MTTGLFLDHAFEEEESKMKASRGQSPRVHRAGNTPASGHINTRVGRQHASSQVSQEASRRESEEEEAQWPKSPVPVSHGGYRAG